MPVISILNRLFFFFVLWSLPLALSGQNIVTVTDGDLRTGNYTWTADNTYLLTERIFLEAGGKLTIQPGTVIKAAANLPVDQATIGLTILPGAEIFAVGTAEAPVIFTVEQDDLSGSIDPVLDDHFKGIWSGLVVMGKPGFNSGHLSYVSIRFAGVNIKGKDNPALSFWMVDRQTQLDHLEVYTSASDGVGIFGGTAFLRNVVVSYTEKDAFNWDYGWTGTGMYWFSFANRRAIDGAGNSLDDQNIFAQPEIYNSTFLMSSSGISLHSNSAGTIANSLFLDFLTGVDIENQTPGQDSRTQLVNGNLNFLNNIFWSVPQRNTEIGQVMTPPEDAAIVNHLIENQNVVSTVGLRSYGCSNAPVFDPRPRKEIFLKAIPNADYPDALLPFRPDDDRKGAFVTEEIWMDGWTALSMVGLIGDAATPKLRFKDQIFASGDTINVDCREMPFFQDSLYRIDPCGIDTYPEGIRSTAGRRGNRKRPSSARSNFGGTDHPAFIEDWALSDIFDLRVASALVDTFKFTINIFDSTPPVIHLITDGQGKLTPYLEDCDEAWITKDSSVIENTGGTTFIHHYYEAIDYSGNQSSLNFTERVGQAFLLYPDLDGDGYGRSQFSYAAGGMLPGFVNNSFDCNDDNALVYPNSFPITGFDCTNPSPNDICSNAIELTAGNCPSYEHNGFSGSSPTTFPALLANCGFPNNYRDVWFKIQVPNSGKVGIDLEISMIAGAPVAGFHIELYSGNCQDLSLLNCYSVDRLDVEVSDLYPGDFVYMRIMEAANIEGVYFLLCAPQLEPIPAIAGDQTPDLDPFEVSPAAGIEKPISFPNPVRRAELLTFDLTGLVNLPESIQIIGSNGIVVREIFLQPGQRMVQLDLGQTNIKPGIYFVRCQFFDEAVTRKLIVID